MRPSLRSAPALTHDAKPTGSTALLTTSATCQRPRSRQTYRRAARRAGYVHAARSAPDCDQLNRVSVERRCLAAPTARPGSRQQKRPDCRRTATALPVLPIRTSLRCLFSSCRVPLAYLSSSDAAYRRAPDQYTQPAYSLGRRSSHQPSEHGGDGGIRTPDLRRARRALSH